MAILVLLLLLNIIYEVGYCDFIFSIIVDSFRRGTRRVLRRSVSPRFECSSSKNTTSFLLQKPH
jgi:hypothetical protein